MTYLYSHGRCNFCTYMAIKNREEAAGKIVETAPGSIGVCLYSRYPSEAPDRRSPDDGNKQWRAAFMELPNHCVC